MTSIVGRGVRVEIGSAYGSAVTVTAISQDNPGVATSTSHAQANKTVGYLSGVEGMVNLEGQAVRVASTATNTFALEDINTTNLSAFTDSCSFTPVSTWATLGRITGYSVGGGEAEKLDDTVLLDDIKQELSGLLAAQTVSFNLNSLTISDSAAAMRLSRLFIFTPPCLRIAWQCVQACVVDPGSLVKKVSEVVVVIVRARSHLANEGPL